jgi:formylglycine-generating enzyme required for sulfatase activity
MNTVSSIAPSDDPIIQDAIERIDAFGKRFTPEHLNLAYHAAFPLALTPDLLYRLRDYAFAPKLKIPWIAVADLLLSGLCYEVGKELYEMDRTVRQVLLNRLTEDNRFGQERLKQLSSFLLDYIDRQISYTNSNLIQAQRWTALAYVRPTEAAQRITQKLNTLLQQRHQSGWLQMGFLVETLAKPLKDANFEPLLTLSQGMNQFARGDNWGAETKFNELRQKGGGALTIAGVTVKLPPKPVPAQTFEFETVTVNRRGEIVQREIKQAKYFTEDLGNDTALDMVYIPGGTFMMGSPEGEGDDDEKPQHQVTVSAFFMGKYPITQAQWREVAALPRVARDLKPDPSHFKGENLPVERVSWDDAVEFCARLSNKTGKNYRLPSEAEWEYACRAGTTTAFYFGKTITSQLANYRANITFADESIGELRGKTTDVGIFPPNSFGLYDMHGNTWEWCADIWHDNYHKAPSDGNPWLLEPNENDNQERRLLRGGSWYLDGVYCRSALRYSFFGDGYDVGFRVVCGVAART